MKMWNIFKLIRNKSYVQKKKKIDISENHIKFLCNEPHTIIFWQSISLKKIAMSELQQRVVGYMKPNDFGS